MVQTCRVWDWDGLEDRAREKMLLIKTVGKKPKIKYSFSNGDGDEYTAKEYGYFQAQRY